MKVLNHKPTEEEESSPSTSAAAVVKEEPHDSQEPQNKKIKLEAVDYDDRLDDVIYVKTDKVKIKRNDDEVVNKELEKYDTEPQIRGNPLEWWKSREGSLPLLAEVAKSTLCVPGTSVPSERVFSKSGQLLNKKRCSLTSKNVDMMIFLNKNYEFKHSGE